MKPPWLAVLLIPLLAVGCANDRRAAVVATTKPAAIAVQKPPLHIHLPGIGGYRNVDRGMLRGLREGGYEARIKPYDWPGTDAGLAALLVTQRHRDQAAKVAEMILAEARGNPGGRITVSAHSAGAGIIAWALEQLPEDVQIHSLVLIAPALSPQYDLSRALAHVRGKAYVLYSPYDMPVLGIGTKMFGTVDGVKAEASGKVGFAPPATADESQYEKLVQIPYRAEWIKLGNIGDHIGALSRPFSRAVLAPLLARGELPLGTAAQEVAEATPPAPLAVPPPLPGPATVPTTMLAPAEAGQ